MKNFLLGLTTGIIIASTGAYAFVAQKAKKAATKENAEKIVQATKDFGGTIKEVFE